MMAAALNTVELARKRAESFGPFDPARYLAMDEACGVQHTAVIQPDGRWRWALDVEGACYPDEVQELALAFWLRSDRANVRRVLDHLIGPGRVATDRRRTDPAAGLMAAT